MSLQGRYWYQVGYGARSFEAEWPFETCLEVLIGWLSGSLVLGEGWSEPAATSAPVQDEAVQAVLRMNQKHILPCPRFLVF
jgi:hypothetical protein